MRQSARRDRFEGESNIWLYSANDKHFVSRKFYWSTARQTRWLRIGGKPIILQACSLTGELPSLEPLRTVEPEPLCGQLFYFDVYLACVMRKITMDHDTGRRAAAEFFGTFWLT